MNCFLIIVNWLVRAFLKKPLIAVFYRITNKGKVTLQALRKIEKISIKVATLNLDEEYFLRCQFLELYPETLKIRTNNQTCLNTKEEFLKVATEKKLKEIKHERRKAASNYEKQWRDIKQNLSVVDYALLLSCLFNSIKTVCHSKLQRQEKK